MVTLTLASGAGIEGGSVSLALSIASTGGDQCTAVQFMLSFNSADVTLTGAVLGSSGTGASKTLSRAGSLIVIWGVNQNVIADGTLATLTFQVANPATHAMIPISPSAIVASDANGNALTTAGVQGSITLNIPVLTCPAGGGSATKNVPYSAQLLASGGTGPYTFSIVS